MDDHTPNGSTEGTGEIGRRKFVTGALAAAGALTAAGALGIGQAAPALARSRCKTAAGHRVAVFGGGMTV